MSQNVEIVKRAIEAYMRDDEAAVRELLAADVVISMRPDQPDPREHHGYDGMLQASAEWLEVWDAQTFEAARIWAVEDLVFVTTREFVRGKTSGVPMEHKSTWVWTLSEGTIVRIQVFGSESEALEAVGPAE